MSCYSIIYSPNRSYASFSGSSSIFDPVSHHSCPLTPSRLGRSNSHSHFIQPVAPTYVTENMAAFQWPETYFPKPKSTSAEHHLETSTQTQIPPSRAPPRLDANIDFSPPGSPSSTTPLPTSEKTQYMPPLPSSPSIPYSQTAHAWERMRNTIDILVKAGEEKSLCMSAQPAVKDHLLDGRIQRYGTVHTWRDL